MHAKYFIIDKTEAYLGSQNFDYRALEHIFELGYHIRSPDLVQNIQQIYEWDWHGKPLSSPKKTRLNTNYRIVFQNYIHILNSSGIN